jgi:putative alpha-1,2-mannosidase
LGLYRAAPDGWPGNDDLGTLSAWYVFGALGLYPLVPGVGVLAIGSPLFERASVAMPHHRRALILASGKGPYVHGLRLDGHGHPRPWTTYCVLARGARLAFDLGRRPDRRWAASAGALPPSYGPRHRATGGACGP